MSIGEMVLSGVLMLVVAGLFAIAVQLRAVAHQVRDRVPELRGAATELRAELHVQGNGIRSRQREGAEAIANVGQQVAGAGYAISSIIARRWEAEDAREEKRIEVLRKAGERARNGGAA